MANERVRLQVRSDTAEHDWKDVGHKTGDLPVPVELSVPVTVTLDSGDVEIGAVELKNSTDDTRATVSAKGLHVYDTVANSLIPSTYDYISLTQATLTDTYLFKTGGSGGTTVSTITITYTDAAKGTISTVAKT